MSSYVYEGGLLELFSSSQIHKMHLATLDVLENVGVSVLESNAQRVLKESGAKVDSKTGIVKFSSNLVEEAVKKAPKKVRLCGRDPKYDVVLEGNKVYTTGAIESVNVIDLDGRRRPAMLKDLENVTRLQDALENIHIVCTAVNPCDIPKKGMGAVTYEAIARNSTKHVFHEADNKEDLLRQIEMASAIVGSKEELTRKPIISYDLCFVSPLCYGKENTEVLIECAKRRIPVGIEINGLIGGTAPVSLVGTLIQMNAEVLCGVVISQLVNPGAPVVYMPSAFILDMRTAAVAIGPETCLAHIVSKQLARHYNLPMCTVSGVSNAKTPDIQAGYEKAFNFMVAAMAGVNLLHSGFGQLEIGRTVSYEQFVIDNEIASMVFRMLRGVDLTDVNVKESLDVIKETGPMGSYLSKKHTLKYHRHEVWMPQITDRWDWRAFHEKGEMGAREVAKKKAREILNEHKPEPLPNDVEKQIHEIAERSYA